jgi:hypothetical protein
VEVGVGVWMTVQRIGHDLDHHRHLADHPAPPNRHEDPTRMSGTLLKEMGQIPVGNFFRRTQIRIQAGLVGLQNLEAAT